MFELAQKQTQAEIVKNKFSVTNIEETMSDLLGSLNQAQTVVDDYTDSDSSPNTSPKNAIIKTPITYDTEQKETQEDESQEESQEETVINNVEIVIDDISGN